MFFDFQFRSLCGIARIPYAAGGLEQQVVELPPQNYSVAKILKKARLQGPASGCQNQPKTSYVRRYLQSILFLEISGLLAPTLWEPLGCC